MIKGDMATLQERYYETLMRRVQTDRYPSAQLMDRIEAALWTAEQPPTTSTLLLSKVDEAWYPSGQLLDRVQRPLTRAATAAR